MKTIAKISIASLALSIAGCQDTEDKAIPSLKSAFEGKFTVGATLSNGMLETMNDPGFAIVEKHFNSISPENCMKWGIMNPEPDTFELEHADRFVDYGSENGFEIVGHVLYWHSQTPDWVFEDQDGNLISREALLAKMRERARMMSERWGDRIKVWDVVNESIEGDGSWRNSKFHQILGDEFNELAFRIAMEELPADAKLIYNDYHMTRPGRQATVIAMVKDFQAKGIRIDGIGIQGHWTMEDPSLEELDEMLGAFSQTGVPLHITELDIDYLGRSQYFGANVDLERLKSDPANNPYPDGVLPEAEEQRFAKRYADIFKILLKHHEHIDRVTFWGVSDLTNWLNDFPVEGRTNFSLLFDRQFETKPAFFSVLEVAKQN